MKKFILASCLFLLSGCIQVTPIANTTNVTDVDFSNVEQFKTGEDCTYFLLGLIGPFGDIQLTEAVRKARISKVKVVDKSFSYYVLFSRSCLHVYGE
ncbi:MAG: TRL domain-containing protein [Alphaproteobacteria bacterium]|nr:TRL domain-containing protein [Alphaproteobacteria bacterium]